MASGVLNGFNKFLEQEVFTRGDNLIGIPLSLVGHVLQTVGGAIGAVFALGTVGLNTHSYQVARQLKGSRFIVAEPYNNLLGVFNPNTKLLVNRETRSKDGLTTDCTKGFFKGHAERYSVSENVFVRNLSSRVTYVALAIACVVTRVADAIIGFLAAILSCIPLFGTKPGINNWAYRGLQATGLINDLYLCTIKFINPWAGGTPQYPPPNN